MFKLEKIVKRDENFADWYTSVINNAQLIVYGQIKGTIIFQPNGWAIWESIQALINKSFKEYGVKNVALPMLIPYDEFTKEAKHLEGFAPECFMVTKVGQKELENPYVVRPTSEIVFCKYFNYISSSYKNLPIKVNQWCSVMRAEKTTRPFLRNSEFHWQELHSIFASKDEALKFTKDIINVYRDIVEKDLCIPVLMGEKTIGERFAGADNTFTIEGLMQDGQLLQCGTSHLLGQNFSKIYDIKFQNKDNKFEYAYQHSAGVSTRIIGALIMVHGDDNGLVLPPAVAPYQIKINVMNAKKQPAILEIANKLFNELKSDNFRVELDDSDNGLGSKLSNGEILGIPIQIVIGNETINNNEVTFIRRDNLIKQTIKLDRIKIEIEGQLKIYKQNIYDRAKKQLEDSMEWAHNIDDLKRIVNNKKIAKVYWAGTEQDEKEVKNLTGATPRVIIDSGKGKCFFTNKEANQIVIFGRAY